MPGGIGANLRPQGLASWTGRLVVISMAPVVGSGHLTLGHPFLRLTSKVSTGKALMPGGPKSIDTVVPSLESKSLPKKGAWSLWYIQKSVSDLVSTNCAFLELTEPVLLGVPMAPIMVIESLVSQPVGVVTVEMAIPVSRMKSIWWPPTPILTMGS
jgi:hypothetical protein